MTLFVGLSCDGSDRDSRGCVERKSADAVTQGEERAQQLHSTNVLERLNKEIKRRSNVVGIFPSLDGHYQGSRSVAYDPKPVWVLPSRRRQR